MKYFLSKYCSLTFVLEAFPAPEVLPDLRDGRPLGDGRREDLAEEREGDGVEALEEGPRVVLVAPLLVDRVLGRRVVPRQLCKAETPLGEREGGRSRFGHKNSPRSTSDEGRRDEGGIGLIWAAHRSAR